MNIDDLKDVWTQQDNNEEVISLEKMSQNPSFLNPIQKLKSYMKIEFTITWILIIGIVTYMYLNPIQDKKIVIFLYFMINLVILSIIYFQYVFIRFYRRNLVSSVSTFQNLIELISEWKMCLHLYRSYNYLIMVLGSPFIMFIKFRESIASGGLSDYNYLLLFVYMFIFLVIGIVFCELWLYFFYGKYLKGIEKIKIQITE